MRMIELWYSVKMFAHIYSCSVVLSSAFSCCLLVISLREMTITNRLKCPSVRPRERHSVSAVSLSSKTYSSGTAGPTSMTLGTYIQQVSGQNHYEPEFSNSVHSPRGNAHNLSTRRQGFKTLPLTTAGLTSITLSMYILWVWGHEAEFSIWRMCAATSPTT